MARSKPTPLYFIDSPETAESTQLCKASDIPVPSRIAEDDTKMQLWTYLVADLEKRQLLSPTYTLVLSEFVEVIVLMHKCRTQMDEQGEMVDIFSDEGQWMGSKPSPWFSMLHKQQAIFIKLAEKLGLTPRDITFLVSPEAVPVENIKQINAEFQNITYFRT